MITPRPGNLAMKVVNQYRRRDVLAYLSLRYYLDNDAARTNQWAREVATDLVLTRSRPTYFPSQHFKEISGTEIVHRTLFIPGANEALAEAALLEECSAIKEFRNPAFVYSYELADRDSRSGVYVGYFKGLRLRHAAISQACADFPRGVVRYLDLKRFYPSIGIKLALSKWKLFGETAGLSSRWYELGAKLLEDYGKLNITGSPALLTGPMFSHLVANLVLREIDEALGYLTNVRYFRYVDDVVLVGESDDVEVVLRQLRNRVSDIGLSLHEENSAKSVTVSCAQWLKGKDDFQTPPPGPSWLMLTRDLKQFLVGQPHQRHLVWESFKSHGFRIPVRDYSDLAQDAGYLHWFKKMAQNLWFIKKARNVTLESLVQLAIRLRENSDVQFGRLLDEISSSSGHERRRLITKLRHHGSRLVYLGTKESLERYGRAISTLPEMIFHGEVMKAVASGNINKVIGMGTNAAQAVAQALQAAGQKATTDLKFFPGTKSQSVAVMLLNGVDVIRDPIADAELLRSSLTRFAMRGANIEEMRSDEDPFVRELACLHGLTDQPRHAAMFNKVFDYDEMLVMDAVDQINLSAS